MENTIVFGAVLGLLIGLGFSVLAFFRKPARYLQAMTARRLSFGVDAPPAVVFERLKAVTLPKTQLIVSDDAARRLVFQTSISIATWGFHFPVYVTEGGAGSLVEVGCASRSIQWGPLVTRAHDSFVDDLKKALGLPSA